jgi:hypothetical protein
MKMEAGASVRVGGTAGAVTECVRVEADVEARVEGVRVAGRERAAAVVGSKARRAGEVARAVEPGETRTGEGRARARVSERDTPGGAVSPRDGDDDLEARETGEASLAAAVASARAIHRDVAGRAADPKRAAGSAETDVCGARRTDTEPAARSVEGTRVVGAATAMLVPRDARGAGGRLRPIGRAGPAVRIVAERRHCASTGRTPWRPTTTDCENAVEGTVVHPFHAPTLVTGTAGRLSNPSGHQPR